MPKHNTTTPAVSLDGYARARRHAASIDRSFLARIVVSGADRSTYLQGLLTNDVAGLKAGAGCYAAYLTPQGRMISDFHVYEIGDVMLLTMARSVRETVIEKFQQFIFSEDVGIGDVTDTFAQIALVGPESPGIAAQVLEAADEASLRALPAHGNLRARFESDAAIVARVSDTGEPGFDLFVDRAKAQALLSALSVRGAAPLDAATADALRIEAGVPAFGRDMDQETIPLEAGIEQRAISFSKGCYVGQEVIVRVLHRGHGRVARKLVGLVIDGEPPAAGTAIVLDGQEIGRITSSTHSPAVGGTIALGYVRREQTAPGTVLAAGDSRAVVAPLPFHPPAS